ncbi:hypothetical protein AB1Y20_012189 [Prymnesium parvum]|uniref:Uncharacterized protein n=1 Tax=Prymnesium parvum TaxID=97485 RepID=A0AB34IQI2_PRYPA
MPPRRRTSTRIEQDELTLMMLSSLGPSFHSQHRSSQARESVLTDFGEKLADELDDDPSTRPDRALTMDGNEWWWARDHLLEDENISLPSLDDEDQEVDEFFAPRPVMQRATSVASMSEASPYTPHSRSSRRVSNGKVGETAKLMMRPQLLCMITHGECEGELSGTMHGEYWLNSPLTPRGKHQAAEKRLVLDGIPFDLVLVAPRLQSVDTAVEIFGPLQNSAPHLLCEHLLKEETAEQASAITEAAKFLYTAPAELVSADAVGRAATGLATELTDVSGVLERAVDWTRTSAMKLQMRLSGSVKQNQDKVIVVRKKEKKKQPGAAPPTRSPANSAPPKLRNENELTRKLSIRYKSNSTQNQELLSMLQNEETTAASLSKVHVEESRMSRLALSEKPLPRKRLLVAQRGESIVDRADITVLRSDDMVKGIGSLQKMVGLLGPRFELITLQQMPVEKEDKEDDDEDEKPEDDRKKFNEQLESKPTIMRWLRRRPERRIALVGDGAFFSSIAPELFTSPWHPTAARPTYADETEELGAGIVWATLDMSGSLHPYALRHTPKTHAPSLGDRHVVAKSTQPLLKELYAALGPVRFDKKEGTGVPENVYDRFEYAGYPPLATPPGQPVARVD